MTANTNQKVMGGAAALLSALQLVDVPDIWNAGHPLITVVVALAALAGTAFGVSNAIRPGAELPTPDNRRGYGWNQKINAAFLFYFLATIAISLVKPFGMRSLTGIVGVLGLIATILYAVRAHRARKQLT
jgi:hypothetical protein